MNLNSLITAPARLGLRLGGEILSFVQSRLGGRPDVDDDTLQQEVESDVFASRRVARSKVEVEVAEGVVWLRGEVRSAAASEEIETRAGAIEGVKRVENLLRVAKPAGRPRAGTQKRPAPTRSARPKPAAATAPPPEAKPAAPAEGRQPAPLGATGATGEGGSPPAPFPSGLANGNGADESSAS